MWLRIETYCFCNCRILSCARPVISASEQVGHYSTPSAFVKCGEFFDQVSNAWLLKKSSTSWCYLIVCKKLRYKQCTYNVTLRRVRITTVDMEKQRVLHILSVSVCECVSVISNLWTVLYCHLWLVWLQHIFPHNLIKCTTLGENVTDFLYNLFLKHFSFQE